jgi:hypothetical protein
MSPSEEIIDFYRQAVRKKKGLPEKTIEEKVSVTPSTPSTSDDPLENFLFKLTDILKTSTPSVVEENKKDEDPKILEEVKTAITETVEENSDKEPLENFLVKLSDILQTSASNLEEAKNLFDDEPAKPLFDDEPKKKDFKPLFDDEPKDKTPNIKNAAIELINNLKQTEAPKEIPKVIKRTDKALPQKKKDSDNKVSYVEELKNADKDPKLPKVSPKDPLREKIEKIVKEISSKQRMGIVSEGGGGDGNFSTEYKHGGLINGDLTVNGNLNVNGTYLSGGLPFTGGGGGPSGPTDRLIAGTESLILSADGTLTFPADTIRTGDGKTLSIESENTSLSSFTKVALSPFAFYAYDSNNNSITFDSTDNEIVLTTLDTYSWSFKNDGKLIGPNNTLDIEGNINSSNKILSGGVDLLDIFGNPADRLINGSYQVVLSSNGDLTLPGAIVTASNSKLDLVGFGPNTAYLTTTPDDTTALFMGAVNAELRANSYVSIATNTGDTTHLWEFGADGSLKFPDNTTQTTAFTGNPDSSNWDSTYTTVKDTSGNWSQGGATPIKRFDYVTGISFDVSYSGTALYGTPETSFTWNIIRLTYNDNGTISNQASALNSWTGRLTATYI